MNNNFRFGFTVEPPNNHLSAQSSDDMDDLFQVGSRKIQLPQIKGETHRSRSRDKKKPKKQKKRHNKSKQKKKIKKSKKQKKKKQYVIEISSDQQQRQSVQEDPMKNLQVALFQDEEQSNQKADRLLLEAYQISRKNRESENTIEVQQFLLKYQINDKALPVDVLHFGQSAIEKYGLSDAEIPRYKRPPYFQQIIGWQSQKGKSKKHKKLKPKDIRQMKKIIQGLNIIINQKNHILAETQQQDNGSTGRYYHYEGYQKVGGSCIATYFINQSEDSFNNKTGGIVEFGDSHKTPKQQDEEKIMKISKQCNIKLSKQPTNEQQWLSFILLQDLIYNLHHNSLDSSNNNKNHLQHYAALDRKLSIIQKARVSLPQSGGLVALEILVMDEMKKQKGEIGGLLQPCLRTISQGNKPIPNIEEYFLFYFQLKVSTFATFSHSYLLSEFQQLKNDHLSIQENDIRSPYKIEIIRNIERKMSNRILSIITMEGYLQLAVTATVADLQFALFSKKRSLEEYQHHYENYKIFKLGQASMSCWDSPISIQNNHKLYLCQQYQMIGTPSFISLHPVFHEKYIDDNPTKFVIFEDIKPFLTLSKNRVSIQKGLDYLCELLELPYVYKHQHPQSMICSWLKSTLFRDKVIACQNLWDYVLWNKYWPPKLTVEFLTEQRISKLFYLLNILETLLEQIPKDQANVQIDITPIRQYIFFINCVTYHEPLMHQYIPSQLSENKLKSIFSKFGQGQWIQNDYYYCRAWSLYVQFMYEYGKGSFEDGLGCLYACFNGIMGVDLMSKLQVLFWMDIFVNVNAIFKEKYTSVILSLLKKIIFIEDLPEYSLLCAIDNNISEMDRLLMANSLKQLLKQTATEKYPTHLSNYFKTIIFKFMIGLGQNSQLIYEKLTQKVLSNKQEPKDFSVGRLFAINLLIAQKCLTQKHIEESNLFRSLSTPINTKIYLNMGLLGYWMKLVMRRYGGAFVGLLLVLENAVNSPNSQQYHVFHHATLLKLLITRLYQPTLLLKNGIPPNHLKSLVMTHIKKRIQQHHPLSIAQLNIPLYQETPINYNWKIFHSCSLVQAYQQQRQLQLINRLILDPQYALNCLYRLPYCRELYRIVAEHGQDGEMREKIMGSILEKQLASI